MQEIILTLFGTGLFVWPIVIIAFAVFLIFLFPMTRKTKSEVYSFAAQLSVFLGLLGTLEAFFVVFKIDSSTMGAAMASAEVNRAISMALNSTGLGVSASLFCLSLLVFSKRKKIGWLPFAVTGTFTIVLTIFFHLTLFSQNKSIQVGLNEQTVSKNTSKVRSPQSRSSESIMVGQNERLGYNESIGVEGRSGGANQKTLRILSSGLVGFESQSRFLKVTEGDFLKQLALPERKDHLKILSESGVSFSMVENVAEKARRLGWKVISFINDEKTSDKEN